MECTLTDKELEIFIAKEVMGFEVENRPHKSRPCKKCKHEEPAWDKFYTNETYGFDDDDDGEGCYSSLNEYTKQLYHSNEAEMKLAGYLVNNYVAHLANICTGHIVFATARERCEAMWMVTVTHKKFVEEHNAKNNILEEDES